MKHRKSNRLNKSNANLGSRFGGTRALSSAAALAVMAASQSVRAQSTIYTYNMNDIVSGVSTSSAGTTISGLTFSNFTTTVGGTANAGSRFSFTNWPLGATNGSDTFSGGIDLTKYDEFTITPANGVTLNLDHINFTVQRSGTGIRQFSVRSNLDTFGNNVSASTTAAAVSVVSTNVFQITDATTSATPGQTVTFGASGNNITSATPIDIRFYGFNAEAAGGTFSLDDVAIIGTITGAATDQYWDTNGATPGIGGDGTWDTTTQNWNAVSTGDGALNAFAPTAPAKFGGTPGTVAVGAAGVSPGSGIQFLTDGYTISGGGGVITLTGNNSVDVASGATATINAVIGGNIGLNKTSTGTLILGGSNTYTGGTSITGVLKITDDSNLGAAGGAITMSSGTLLAGANLTLGRNVTINAGSRIDTNGFTVQLNNPINGNAGLIKQGAGTLILNAPSASGTFTGTVAVNAGTLSVAAVDGSNSSGLGIGAATVNNGGTLEINGVALGNSSGNSAPIITLANGAALVGRGVSSYTRSGGPLITSGTLASPNAVDLIVPTAGSVFTIGAAVRQSPAGAADSFATIRVSGLGRVVLQSGAVTSSTTFAGNWQVNSGILQIGPVLTASTAPLNALGFKTSGGAGNPALANPVTLNGGILAVATNQTNGDTTGATSVRSPITLAGGTIATTVDSTNSSDLDTSNGNGGRFSGDLTVAAGPASTILLDDAVGSPGVARNVVLSTENNVPGSITWQAGSTLNVTGSGTLQILRDNSQGGAVTVLGNAQVNVGSNATVNLGGTLDALGDTTSGAYVNIANNGTFNVIANSKNVGDLTGSGSTTLADSTSLTAGRVVQSSLTLSGSGSAAVRKTATNNSALSVVGTLSLGSGSVDLNNNDLVITGADGSTLGTVQSLINSAANHGAFDGTSGITSSVAKAINADPTPLKHTGLGYAVASSVGINNVDSTHVDGSSVVVKYTLIGDANLDGVVNALDFNALAINFGQTGDWSHGDFTYDNAVDTNDFTEMAKNFLATLPAPPASPALGSLVPEPMALGLLGLAALALPRRRRA